MGVSNATMQEDLFCSPSIETGMATVRIYSDFVRFNSDLLCFGFKSASGLDIENEYSNLIRQIFLDYSSGAGLFGSYNGN